MKYYIYKIENLINHKVYIGLTNNIERRRNRHFSDLRHNRHDNHFLQKEFNIYGEENFSFSVIFEDDITEKEIGDKEKYYIKQYDSYKNGYNQNEGGNFGASNGGSHLTEKDIFEILAAIEFAPSRPGEILSQVFGVTKTTISRIRKSVNHIYYIEEYNNKTEEEKKQIYQDFCKRTNFEQKVLSSTKLRTKRRMKDEDVYLILCNFEKRIVSLNTLMKYLNVSSSNTLYSVKKGESYKDCAEQYKLFTEDQKQKLVTLLRNL